MIIVCFSLRTWTYVAYQRYRGGFLNRGYYPTYELAAAVPPLATWKREP